MPGARCVLCGASPLARSPEARILVVEDSATVARVVADTLTDAGFEVEIAGRGDDGLRMALCRTYDLILLDIELPLVDGWEILKQLRTSAQGAPPVVVLSGSDDPSSPTRAVELGAARFLRKPVSPGDVLARIMALIPAPTTAE